jgi:hypothetical protein
MSTGSVILVVLIAVWGVLEYQRRERKQKTLLASISQGAPLAGRTIAPAVWKLLGEATVALLLGATSVLMLYGGGQDRADPGLLYGMSALFGVMMVLILLMLVRDMRTRRLTRHEQRGKP